RLVSETLSEEFFVVQISLKPGNRIEIIMDGDNGVSIQKCVEISRHVEENLDRESEDFELNVSSAGLGNPFKIYRQYLKNIGKKVEVKQNNEKPVTGILVNVDPEGFDLEITSREKQEGKNKKVEVVKTVRFRFDNNPEVRNSISFN
ncbi:MAG TPA: ribosome assembly cofactor RimP, partial [Prolixibacteraceae bacterium]|nr:ribosome assembly cofactor RimP [Prolixibacteraceae bacterium]